MTDLILQSLILALRLPPFGTPEPPAIPDRATTLAEDAAVQSTMGLPGVTI
jgi:hypothetical protein